MKTNIFLIILFCSIVPIHAIDNIPQIIPPSPNASALGIYGQANINYYNGLINTEIPLYKIEGNGYEFPIDLSYNSGGIKVDQIASWVGMGWSLNAGGVITRVVRGLADEASYGYSDYISNTIPNVWSGADHYKFLDYAFGARDSEPDEFYFNFFGNSGKFVMAQDGSKILIPYQNLKIENTGFHDFTITDIKGFKYFFDMREYTTATSQKTVQTQNSYQYLCSAWYLSKVITPTNETINLIYEDYNIDVKSPVGQHETFSYPTNSSDGITTFYNQYQSKRLSQIQFKGGTIDFLPGENRYDLLGDKFLEEICVKNNNGEIVKKYSFNYKYLYGVTGNEWRDISVPCNDPICTRLFLNSLSELSNNDINIKKTFQFEYYANLPARLSFAQDHWGYYNSNNVSTLIPSVNFNLPYGSNETIYHEGAYKEPDVNYAQGGMLNKITYPTGGTQEFEYELNECSSIPGLQNNFVKKISSINSILYDTSQSFNLNSSTLVTFKFNSSGIGKDNPNNWPIRFYLTDVNNNILFSINNYQQLDNIHLYLSAGVYNWNYQIVNTSVPLGYSGNYYEASACWDEYSLSNNIKVGGLRIYRITTSSNLDKIVKYFEYKNDVDASSGYIVSIPNYKPYSYAYCSGTTLPPIQDMMTLSNVLNSSSNYILSNTLSSPVGYSKVTEYYSQYQAETGKYGKTEYYYTNPQTYPDDWKNIINQDGNTSEYYNGLDMSFPYAPATSKDWKRGKLLMEKTYKKTNSIYDLIEEDSFSYDYKSIATIRPLKVAISVKHVLPDVTYSSICYNYYQIESGYANLTNKTKKTYSQGANITTSVDYSYNDLLLPIRIFTTGSNNDQRLTTIKYPIDYVNFPNYQGQIHPIELMKQKNMINYPIEQKDYLNAKVTNTDITTYMVDQYSDYMIIKPAGIYKLNIQNPITDFTALSTGDANNAYVFDARMGQEFNFKYYPDGNIKEVYSPKTLMTTTYLWSYNNQYPVVKIEGLTYAQVTNIFPQTSIDILASTPNPTVDMLNSIRSAFAGQNALITTYTYQPLIGISTATAPNGVVTTYKYDSFNRLWYLKDNNGNNILNNQYHYGNH